MLGHFESETSIQQTANPSIIYLLAMHAYLHA
jgi:hypothetical protein